MARPFSIQIKNKIEAGNNLFDERSGMLDHWEKSWQGLNNGEGKGDLTLGG